MPSCLSSTANAPPTNIRKSSTNEFWEQVCHDIREWGQREWSQKVLMLRSGAWVQKSPGAAKTSVYPLMGTFCYRVNKSSSSSQRGLWKPSENTCFLGLTQHRQGRTIFLLCALVCRSSISWNKLNFINPAELHSRLSKHWSQAGQCCSNDVTLEALTNSWLQKSQQ